MQKSKIIINSLLIFSLITPPSFCLAQGVEETKDLGTKILTALPDVVKEVWQKMWAWAKPKIDSLWQTSNIKEEFQKEKQEIKEDLWQRFKDLLR